MNHKTGTSRMKENVSMQRRFAISFDSTAIEKFTEKDLRL